MTAAVLVTGLGSFGAAVAMVTESEYAPAVMMGAIGEMYGQPLVGLRLRDPSAVDYGGGSDLLRHIEQPMTGHQRAYMVVGMPVSPDWVLSTIQRYIDDKEARADIGREPVTITAPA